MLSLFLLVVLTVAYWEMKRANEMRASGAVQSSSEPKSWLYWLYNALGVGVIGYIAKAKSTEVGAWWLLILALLVAAIL
jgi:hypothetical protein